MKSLERRGFLQMALGAVAIGASGVSCRRPRRRADVLAAIVLDVVTPDVKAVANVSDALETTACKLADSPSRAGLAAAQATLRSALVAWKRARAFRGGPMVETNALLRASFWPARPSAIEAALQGSNSIDQAFVEELGVDAKGLYALEYLLFPLNLDEGATFARLTDESAGRRRALLKNLAVNVALLARKSAASLGNGDAYSARFAQGGQQSVSRLVGQMAGNIEGLSVNRLELVLELAQNRMLKPGEIEGWPSGTSQQLVAAELETTGRFYGSDAGIAEIVRPIAPAIDQRVHQRFIRAIELVTGLKAPLERAVVDDRAALAVASAAMKELEIALKVDLANALGVTLSFQTGDGD